MYIYVWGHLITEKKKKVFFHQMQMNIIWCQPKTKSHVKVKYAPIIFMICLLIELLWEIIPAPDSNHHPANTVQRVWMLSCPPVLQIPEIFHVIHSWSALQADQARSSTVFIALYGCCPVGTVKPKHGALLRKYRTQTYLLWCCSLLIFSLLE